MKPQIKTIITYMLLLLFVSGCGASKTSVPISETVIIQAAYSMPGLSQQEASTEDTGNIVENTENISADSKNIAEDAENIVEDAENISADAGNISAYTELSMEDTKDSQKQPEDSTESAEYIQVFNENQINPAWLTSSMPKLLQTSIMPVGSTMYIWGGGWNEEDTGSGIESVTLGLSPTWAQFAAQQPSGYDYQTTRYQIHNGLDCSGYIGWLIYNTFHTNNGEPGYVCKAANMASTLSSYGWGSYIYAGDTSDFAPGDICSMRGHVWMCLGKCSDGSVLLVHASPPGVRVCGTQMSDGSASQAVCLAEKIMSSYYPDWYQRYPDCAVNYSYLSSSSKMRWSSDTLSDAGSYQGMSADDIAAFLFPGTQ